MAVFLTHDALPRELGRAGPHRARRHAVSGGDARQLGELAVGRHLAARDRAHHGVDGSLGGLGAGHRGSVAFLVPLPASPWPAGALWRSWHRGGAGVVAPLRPTAWRRSSRSPQLPRKT
jgi:hypothetical protein